MSRRHLLIGAATLAFSGYLPAKAAESVRLSGRAFGTSWQVTLSGAADPRELAGEIADLLEGIDRAMSPFRPDSEISRFNRAAAGRHAAGADFATVTSEALRIAALSGGAFDPSVGPDVGRFGFGPIRGVRAGSFAGFSADAHGVRKDDAALSLDLCGIAKGHALDVVADRLRRRGLGHFLIEIGGELLAEGEAPTGGAWRLGIADPVAGGVHSRLRASGLAVATSGDAVNAYEVAGRRYSHTIDPATGEPVVNRIASVSVAHRSAMTADGFATALMVLGPERGLALAESARLPVLFLLRGEGRVEPLANRAFEALMET